MMAVPAAHYLVDFRPRHLVVTSHDTRTGEDRARSHRLDAEYVAVIAEAEARGRGEERLAAAATAEAELAELRASLEERHAAERARWVDEQGEHLSGRIRDELAGIANGLAASVATILDPFLTDAIRVQVIDDLSAAVGVLLTDPQRPLVTVTGPEDLLEAMRVRLGPKAAAIGFSPGEGCEVTVVAGATSISTQLQSWGERLRQAGREL